MAAPGLEAATLSRWSRVERLTALKRIISTRAVTEALRLGGRGGRVCPTAPDWFVVLFVVAMGLFSGDCYRQVCRWLMPRSRHRRTPLRSTLCEARHRLGVRPLALLARRAVKLLADAAAPGDASAFYRGMRLMALDGFVLDLPDSPANAKAFGRPGSSRAPAAFAQARVVALCEAGTHVIWRWLIKHCRCGEARMAPYLLRQLRPDMLLLWDRGFFKYAHVKQVLAARAHVLARVKKDLILRPLKRLSDGSYLSRVYRNAYDRKHDRGGIDVRVIEYELSDPGRAGHKQKHRLLTTLLDEKLDPAKTLVELYHWRWEQELAFDEIKSHELERPVLRSQTPAGVMQEIHGLLLAHYVIRTLMHQSAAQRQTSPLRLSFVHTLKILRCRLGECPKSPRGARQWLQDLLEEIAEEQLPPRRNRSNPRVIRRKMSNWKKKRPKDRNYPQPTRAFRDSILILR